MLYKSAISIILLAISLTVSTSCGDDSLSGVAPKGEHTFEGPLRISGKNPRYFTDGSGRAIYLTGSHTWANFKDRGTTDPPPGFHYTDYLNTLDRCNHNFIRLWTWELTKYQYSGEPTNYVTPFPWPRTGPGTALDGKAKFDLSRFDESYFDRLRSRVMAAGDKGIYVAIMLFEGHGIRNSLAPWRWDGHPFNMKNNINGINGDPNGDGQGLEIHTLDIPSVTVLQEGYVEKVIDTLNDLDNVIYEIANESHQTSGPWQRHMIEHIHRYEAEKAKQHPVLYSAAQDYPYSEMWSSNAEIVSPGWPPPGQYPPIPYRDDPPVNDGSKIVVNDTDHLWGIGGDRQWVWMSFTRGLHPVYMDNMASTSANIDMRKNMGYTLTYANRMNLKSMIPSTALCSTTYCLVDPGREYLVYKKTSGTNFTVNLPAGDYVFEWFNPATGAVASTGSISSSGGNRSFTPPFSGDAVLYIYAQ